jgi:predicted RecA/RadA family phage recombinase
MSASVPSGNDPITLLIGSESGEALLVGESVAVTIATTPLLRAVALIPDATQTKVPVPGLQLSVSPTAVKAGPGVALRETIAVVEYVSVHCSAEGAPVPTFNERLSGSELPGAADPDAKLNEAA